MENEIKSLFESKEKSPPMWSMFIDATGGYSFTRIAFFITLSVFLTVWVYTSFQKGEMVEPPKPMIYLLLTYGVAKPIQRYAETKEVEAQLNYDFQMAQLDKPLDKTNNS